MAAEVITPRNLSSPCPMVARTRFELATPCSQSKRSTGLSHLADDKVITRKAPGLYTSRGPVVVNRN